MYSLQYFYTCMYSWDHNPDEDKEHFHYPQNSLGLLPSEHLPLEVIIIVLTSITEEK